MLKYRQSTGEMFASDGSLIGKGYSGAGPYKNNPEMQMLQNRGPIPQGKYDIGPPHNTLGHGPYVLTLTPHPGNEMFDRGGFLIHGDSIEHPGTASKGCIILSRAEREQVWANESVLEVVA